MQSLKSKKKANLDDKPYEPNIPVFQQIISMDSTKEALRENLLFNKREVIKVHEGYWFCKRDEPIQRVLLQKPFVSIVGDCPTRYD
ncbi:hypothetical protein [Bacillus velezensis]|uniref:hypothetical protein n=1 Tax=Bacillus velezensis TaxID=492670 RepID=UPI0024C050F6|nr:hypothetical protein [Bacillus velezensis]WHY39217.1 hypothetical protein QNH19_03215 [Bacillus velezensis]